MNDEELLQVPSTISTRKTAHSSRSQRYASPIDLMNDRSDVLESSTSNLHCATKGLLAIAEHLISFVSFDNKKAESVACRR